MARLTFNGGCFTRSNIVSTSLCSVMCYSISTGSIRHPTLPPLLYDASREEAVQWLLDVLLTFCPIMIHLDRIICIECQRVDVVDAAGMVALEWVVCFAWNVSNGYDQAVGPRCFMLCDLLISVGLGLIFLLSYSQR